MAASVWSKPVTDVTEIGSLRTIVDRFEDHMYDLLHYFVPHTGDTEFAHLPVWLGYELLSYRYEAELFGFHLLNDLSDGFQGESIKSFFVCSRGHIPRFRLDS